MVEIKDYFVWSKQNERLCSIVGKKTNVENEVSTSPWSIREDARAETPHRRRRVHAGAITTSLSPNFLIQFSRRVRPTHPSAVSICNYSWNVREAVAVSQQYHSQLLSDVLIKAAPSLPPHPNLTRPRPTFDSKLERVLISVENAESIFTRSRA